MALRLVFLGRTADLAGGSSREVATASSLAAVVAALEPGLAEALGEPRIRRAVNGTLVQGEVVLGDGDEIAFLPPVSGG